MPVKKIVVFVGSLRKESFNRKIAKALFAGTPKSLAFEILEIGELPLYNQDLDEKLPSSRTEFRNNLKGFDGVLFVTPDYNRSLPGALKNAIDIASRPYGKNVLDGKPGAVVSVPIGANHHLRQSLVFLKVPTMQQPEAYIGDASKLFDNDGHLVSESTRNFLHKFMDSFSLWVSSNASQQPKSII